MTAQLARSGRYRSWMSYIRDFGRWLRTNGADDAYVLSDRWKAGFVPAHPYLLTRREIDAFFTAAAALDVQSPWRWQAVAFFVLMHSCGLRTGEARALRTEQVDLAAGHIDIVWSKGNRSRRLPLTGQVIDVLDVCDRRSCRQFPARGRSSSPPAATRSPRPRSARCSVVSGTRRGFPGRPGVGGHGHTTCGIRWTAGLCALRSCFRWWGPRRWCPCPHNPGLVSPAQRVEPADRGWFGLARCVLAAFRVGEGSPHLFVPLPDAEVIVMGETDVGDAVSRVLAVLRDAGRSEGTVRRQRVVLDRFAAFLTGRGLDTASERGVHRLHRESDRGQVGVVAGAGQRQGCSGGSSAGGVDGGCAGRSAGRR